MTGLVLILGIGTVIVLTARDQRPVEPVDSDPYASVGFMATGTAAAVVVRYTGGSSGSELGPSSEQRLPWSDSASIRTDNGRLEVTLVVTAATAGSAEPRATDSGAPPSSAAEPAPSGPDELSPVGCAISYGSTIYDVDAGKTSASCHAVIR